MKKFILVMVAVLTTLTMSAQNYAGSSKFTDNVSVSLQGGVLTTANEFCSGHTAVAPIAALSIDKFVTPWLGFGTEGRTLIGTGHGKFNTHTAFDAVNVSGYAKVNLTNVFMFNGTRRFFEPVVYTGLGWGHMTTGFDVPTSYDPTTMDFTYKHKHANYMTWRSGVEFNFNFAKGWAAVVNPSVVWGNPYSTEWSTKLNKHNLNVELMAGVRYNFKTSNGSFTKPHLYDQVEIDRLNDYIKALEARKPEVVENIVEKIVTLPAQFDTFMVAFDFDSAKLNDAALEVLADVPQNVDVTVEAFSSYEPKTNELYNLKLSEARMNAVIDYLKAHNVNVVDAHFHGTDDTFGRLAVIKIVQ